MRGVAARLTPAKRHEQSRARYLDGAAIHRVHGRQAVKGVEIKRADGGTERIDCDLIAMSGGWNPTIHLTTHLNGKPVWSEELSALLPGKLPPGMSVVGAAAGDFGLGSSLASGQKAGAEAAASCGFTVPPRSAPTAKDEDAGGKSGLAGG